MIPQYLKIKGLYSYQTEQEIHFDKLTDAALFGIFGMVGSGKSSILEAITFALYGDTERLNSKQNRNYNMMNLRSDSLSIDFVCLAGADDAKYRFTVFTERDPKDFLKIKSHKRQAYKWFTELNGWSPIRFEDPAEKIIGLDYQNFRRTIIIPQGNFQEFIDLGGAEKSKMMQKIFTLDKYDLDDRIKILIGRNNERLSEIEGQMKGLGEATPEYIEQQEHNLRLKKEEIKVLDLILKDLYKEELELAHTQKLFEKLKEATNEIIKLENQSEAFQQREERLKIYERCLINFKHLLDQNRSKCIEQQQVTKDLDINIGLLEQKIHRSQVLVAELEKVRPYYENREEYNEKSKELQAIISIKKLEETTAIVRDRITNGSKILEDKEKEIGQIRENKLGKENELEQLKIAKKQVDTTYENDLSHLIIQQSLQKFAEGLKEEEPCPLCGSVHHPNILSTSEDFTKQIALLKEKYSLFLMKGEEIEKEIKNLNNLIEISCKEKERYEFSLNQLKNEYAGSEGQKKIFLEQLRIFNIEQFTEKSIIEIQELERKTQENYRKIKETFENLDKENRELEGEVQKLNGIQIILKTNLEGLEKGLVELRQKIDEQLLIDEFDSEEAVLDILKQNLSIDFERKAIHIFQTNLQSHKKTWMQISEEVKDRSYELDKHLELKSKIFDNDLKINNLRTEQGGLEEVIKSLRASLETKKTLLEEKQRLDIRKENLSTLMSLFRSSGFVNYVSSIYLQNLCKVANDRFHRMTRQQLYLEVNENNDFEVRDLLNGGKTRLLKTLSGGQKFQAALSLALALADNIHSRTPSKHNFFFLDEGFGSLDKDSLQTVFETLKSLRKENRIVGVISHVEDLQQEISTYLSVKSTEEGSKITPSW